MNQIEIKNITKIFGETTALKDVTVTIEANKIYGLLGRNGAGKTTLLNLMTNKLFPTKGEILIEGQNVLENDQALSQIYCMTESRLYPENMKVKTAFKWTRSFYPDFDRSYADLLAKKFGLDIHKKVKSLSTGYGSIFKMIIALSCQTKILLLDEPVLGLDANHRDLFYKELLANYSAKPKTIIISTHLIEEAADLLEEVIIIKEGEVLLVDHVENLLSKGYTLSGTAALVEDYIKDKNVLAVDNFSGLKTAYLLDEISSDKLPQGLVVTKLDLQQMFIHLTNV